MIKVMSLLLTFFLFFMTAAMTLADGSEPLRTPNSPVKTPESNLSPTKSQDKKSNVALQTNTPVEKPSDDVSDQTLGEKSKELIEQMNGITIMRLSWKPVTNAVKYKVSFDNEEYMTYINGIEVAVKNVSKVFKIIALDFENNVIVDDLDVIAVETNPTTVKTTTEFDKMDYAPLYPVYSWVPKHNADYYLIELLRDGEVIRTYQTPNRGEDDIYDFYDEQPVNEGGEYYWRVKAMSKYGIEMSDWSKQTDSTSFKVTAPTKFAAFGDSITHGGGAVTVPPSMIIYNWETYCSTPIKNLGRSGDTTEQLLNRFDNDVLPFAPKILIIMAGVNDFRSHIIGWNTVANYKEIAEKCRLHNIVPVFVTPTPVNPYLIKKAAFIEQPPYDWHSHYKYACDWIKQQNYHIDITSEFEDFEGNLRADLTTDGLHPDYEGKKIIGQAVNDWFNKNKLLE